MMSIFGKDIWAQTWQRSKEEQSSKESYWNVAERKRTVCLDKSQAQQSGTATECFDDQLQLFEIELQ